MIWGSHDRYTFDAYEDTAMDNYYDPALAVTYGQFVDVAYQMYGSDPANPTPAPPAALPSGYRFIAWVQMRTSS